MEGLLVWLSGSSEEDRLMFRQHWEPQCAFLPDELLNDIMAAHSGGMVERGATVVAAAVGVRASLQENMHAVQMPVDHCHIQRCLALHIYQVHFSSLTDEEVHTVAVACGGSDAERRARQPATTPHRLFINPPVQREMG